MAGERIAEVDAGLDAAIADLESRVSYGSTDPAVGTSPIDRPDRRYLSARAGVAGKSLAYLKAAPLEATRALDQAVKQAAVDLVEWLEPPTPTTWPARS